MKRLILVTFVMVLILSHFNYLTKWEIKITLEDCVQSPICIYLCNNGKENNAHMNKTVVHNEGKPSLHNLLTY